MMVYLWRPQVGWSAVAGGCEWAGRQAFMVVDLRLFVYLLVGLSACAYHKSHKVSRARL